MHPASPSATSSSENKDMAWWKQEQPVSRPPSEGATNVYQIEFVSELIDDWLKTQTPEQQLEFFQSVQNPIPYDPDHSSISEELLFTDSGNEVTAVPLEQQAQIIPSLDCNLRASGQGQDQFQTSMIKFDPDSHLNALMEQGRGASTSLVIPSHDSPPIYSEELVLEPTDISEQEFFLEVQEDYSSGVRMDERPDPRQFSPAGYYEDRIQQWAMTSGNFGPKPGRVRQMDSVDTTISDGMSDPDDDQRIQDEEQSISSGSIRLGSRRYSSEEKKERRREQNRRAATKCRNRKKVAFESFREECERVKLENRKQKAQILALQAQAADLFRIVQYHKRTCTTKNGA